MPEKSTTQPSKREAIKYSHALQHILKSAVAIISQNESTEWIVFTTVYVWKAI